jgi:hypothetical protein
MSKVTITPTPAPTVEFTQSDRQALQDFADGSGTQTTAQLTAIMRVAARYLLSVIDEVVFVRKVKGK